MLEVNALLHAAEFNVFVAAYQFERYFLAGLGHGIVDLAETALADPALDDVAIKRSITGAIDELGHHIT
jgi:hypothetical protein